MVHKDEKKKKKSIKTNVKLLFDSLVCTNENVDIQDFVKNSNEYMADPKNGDGCILTMHLINCEIKNDLKNKKENKEVLSDKLDKFIHFSFRGIRFTVDTEERTVLCNAMGLKSEIISDKNEDGLYNLNVETSN